MSLACLSPNGVDVYALDGPPSALLVATLKGVVRLERRADAREWTNAGVTLEGVHVGSLMRAPRSGALFAGAHGGGLFRSRDGGKTWTRTMSGIAHEHIFSLAVIEIDGQERLFAGTEPPHLYASDDDGDTWRELEGLRHVAGREGWNFPAPPHIAHVKHIARDPRDARRLYVCVEQGALLRSDDGGETFTELHFQDATYKLNKDVHRVVFNPTDPDDIWVPGGDGITRSRDGGKTWIHLTTPEMRLAYPDHFYYPASGKGAMFAVGGGTPPNVWRQTGDARTAVVVSHDQGKTWTQIGGGLPAEVPGNFEAATMVVWPGGFGFFVGSTDGEVYASLDEGVTWSLAARDLGAVSKCIHARNLEMGRAAVRQQSQARPA